MTNDHRPILLQVVHCSLPSKVELFPLPLRWGKKNDNQDTKIQQGSYKPKRPYIGKRGRDTMSEARGAEPLYRF